MVSLRLTGCATGKADADCKDRRSFARDPLSEAVRRQRHYAILGIVRRVGFEFLPEVVSKGTERTQSRCPPRAVWQPTIKLTRSCHRDAVKA